MSSSLKKEDMSSSFVQIVISVSILGKRFVQIGEHMWKESTDLVDLSTGTLL